MDVRKLLAIAVLAGTALALEAAILHHFVAAPLAAAIRDTRSGGTKPDTAQDATTARPELTEEVEVVAPRRKAEPPPPEEPAIAGAASE